MVMYRTAQPCCVLHCTDGGLILGSSSLTNRLWSGELLFFSSCTKEKALSECDARTQLDCGVSDIKWIAATQRCVAACDSGSCGYSWHVQSICTMQLLVWQWHHLPHPLILFSELSKQYRLYVQTVLYPVCRRQGALRIFVHVLSTVC